MEPRNRNVWLIVIVVAAAACLCLLAAGIVAWRIASGSVDWSDLGRASGERIDRTFQVGESPSLEIDNFAGQVTVRAGAAGQVHIVAVKHARSSRLAEIEVQIAERADGLTVQTRRPSALINAWVELDVTVPAGTRLVASTGSGEIEISNLKAEVSVKSGSGQVTVVDAAGSVKAHSGSGSVTVDGVEGSVAADTGSGSIVISEVSGSLEAHTGSGSIEVRSAEGPARLDTGSGRIDYSGLPRGDCRFETGSGSIKLALPAEVNLKVDLSTGSGRVRVDYAVEGDVERRAVKGTIGTGADGSIYAHTGSGDIDLSRR